MTIAKYGLPHICGIGFGYNDWAARALVDEDRLTMETPLEKIYPDAWVLTSDGCWSLAKFHTESDGVIVGGIFLNEWVTLSSTTVPANSVL